MTASPTATIPTTSVFANGEAGIGCYRIPSIVRMATGELLAVCEARVDNCGDHGGPIRLVAKISDPTGQHWSAGIEVARNILPDGEEQVAQNPALVVDKHDPDHPGKIVLMFNKAEFGEADTIAGKGVRRVFVIESRDHGRTWEGERDITAQVHRPYQPNYTRIHADAAQRYNDPADWRGTFPPVGHAIQLHGGAAGTLPTRGRLLFATYVTRGTATVAEGQAHLVYSDDHGKTWATSDLSPVTGINEMMAVERANGDILVNFRNYIGADGPRMPGRGQVVFRTLPDGSYEVPTSHRAYPNLPMPPWGLQGAIHRLADTPHGPMFYTGCDNADARVGMDLWRSDDEGDTWANVRCIDPGPSAYSDMVTLADGQLGIIYELGGDNGIAFGVVNPQ